MYSSTSADDAFHHLSRRSHERRRLDPNRRIHAERLDDERHAEPSDRLGVEVASEHNVVRERHAVVREELLRERFVLAQIELARASAGVLHPEELEPAGDRDVPEYVASEHLHQIEDEAWLLRPNPSDELLHVAVHAEDLHLVFALRAKGRGDLIDDFVALARPLSLQVGEDRDVHREASCCPSQGVPAIDLVDADYADLE
jgi:hypothetical protein